MPLGSEYSVEKQLKGWSLGLQLQTAPRMKDYVRFGAVGAPLRLKENTFKLWESPSTMGLQDGMMLSMSETDKRFSFIAPWDWEDGEKLEERLEVWSFWKASSCDRGRKSCCHWCRRAQSAIYSPEAWPTVLLDIYSQANLNIRQPIVVSALPPITVTLHYTDQILGFPMKLKVAADETKDGNASLCPRGSFHRRRKHLPVKSEEVGLKLQFSQQLQITRFESIATFEWHVGHAIGQWYSSNSGQDAPEWVFDDARLRRSRDGCRHAKQTAILKLGITDGSTVETHGYKPWSLHFWARSGPRLRPQGWEMALAPGALIQQDLKPDLIPHLWNWDAAQLIDIQLLNTVGFETVTGLAPPVSPVTLEECLKAKIPSLSFYESEEEQASTLVIPRFPAVKTVAEIDQTKTVAHAVRVKSGGELVACIVCERKLCDLVLEPCHHTFCVTCIEMHRRSGEVISPQCSTPAQKVTMFAAPCPIPQRVKRVPPDQTTEQSPSSYTPSD
ncbi:hypothetical protein VTI74DRAFT_310 [Chaetomium olivicolor]